jgi:hypothetical protein
LGQWLDRQVDQAFDALLRGFRLAPHNPDTVSALVLVVCRHLRPWCRKLLRDNPGLLRSKDGIREDAVEEAIQVFLLHLLASDRRVLLEFRSGSIRAFRGWLTVAFRNHRISELRLHSAVKRGGKVVMVPLDCVDPGSVSSRNSGDPEGRADARRALAALPDKLDELAREGATEKRDAALFRELVARQSGDHAPAEDADDALTGPQTASGRGRAVRRARQRLRDALGWGGDDA